MSVLLLRSRVKANKVADVEADIRRLASALEQAGPQSTRYGWFRLADGVTFVILTEVGEEGPNTANSLPEAQALFATLKVATDGQPVSEQMTMIASYRFFSA